MKNQKLLLGALSLASSASLYAQSLPPKLDFDCVNQIKTIVALSAGFSPQRVIEDPSILAGVRVSHLTVTNTFRDAAGFIEGVQNARVSSQTESSNAISGRISIRASRGGVCTVKSLVLSEVK